VDLSRESVTAAGFLHMEPGVASVDPSGIGIGVGPSSDGPLERSRMQT